MSEQHIDNLIIKNFKCFQELKLENIGQVNLIGGKNNVGKTAFLEAVEIFTSSNKPYELANSIFKILRRRQTTNRADLEIDFIYDDNLEMKIISPSKTCTLQQQIFETPITTRSGETITTNNNYPVTISENILSLSVNDDVNKISIDSLDKIGRFPVSSSIKEQRIYIPSSKVNEQNISIYYGILVELGMEDFLINSLRSFDSKISDIKIIPKERSVILKLKLENKNSLVLLSSLGEGVNRYIAILCAIWANKDGVLLIDEIENGIHYTNYKKLWEIIFQASIDANCQLFITSHSKECITAFNDVQFEIVSCNAQYFEFYKNLKTDLITSSARDKEQLRYALTHDGRIRGE